MIQSRNKYLQFMLVLLAAWAIAWGAMFVMGQAVLLYGLGKNVMFFSGCAVLVYLLCVFLVYRRWVAPLPVVGQLRNVGGLCRIKKSSDNMLFFFAMLPDYAVDPKSLQTSALSC